MKQLKKLLTSAFIASAILVGCTEDEPALDITDISFDGTKVTVNEGFTYDLEEALTISGADADQAEISFSSGDATIVSVDGFTLTAVEAGNTTVTATEANSELTATVEVEVLAKTVAVTSVTLDKSEANLKVGETFQLTATIAPADATETGLTWSVGFPPESKNLENAPEDIATVSETGLVTAKAAGSIVVTAKTKDGEFTASASISVTNVAVTQITISPESATVNVNETVQLTATIIPENATIKDVTWSVDFDAEAGRMQIAAPTVDYYLEITEDGLLKAKERCDECAFIARATSSDEEVSSFINVIINYVPVESITLAPSSLFTIHKGFTKQIEYTVLPANATDPTITWKISNTMSQGDCGLSSINYDDYAMVDGEGVITAVNPFANDCNDNLIVEAHHTDLASPASSEFDVTIPVSDLTITIPGGGPAGSSINLSGCSNYKLDVTVGPGSASNSVTWSVDQETSLTVDQTGLLIMNSGLPTGSTTTKVTVTANDGSGVLASIDVIVNFNGC